MRGQWGVGIALVVATAAGCASGSGPAVAKIVGSPEPKASPTAAPVQTFTKSCPPVADGSPSWRVTLPKPARQVGKTVAADVDGDGRLDDVRLMSGWRTEWGGIDELTVRFAHGGNASVQMPADESAPGNQILGIADINADHRAEIILWTGGNTLNGGDAVTLVGRRLMIATTCAFDRADGWFRESPLRFWGHGNACGRWCDVTSACRYVDGQPRLVTVDGWTSGARRRWTVTLYRLVGADFQKSATYHGSVRGDGPLPTRWPFLNALSCGTATFPGV